MNKDTRSKMTRQLQIYYRLSSSKIIGPNDLMQEFDISRRMLQRDLKDIRDCGLLNAKLDRGADNYITDKDAVFDETAKDRRRQHLIKHRRGSRKTDRRRFRPFPRPGLRQCLRS